MERPRAYPLARPEVGTEPQDEGSGRGLPSSFLSPDHALVARLTVVLPTPLRKVRLQQKLVARRRLVEKLDAGLRQNFTLGYLTMAGRKINRGSFIVVTAASVPPFLSVTVTLML